MKNRCLNCNHHVDRNFCPDCGQKITTHRFSLKHLFLHDFVHGVFHLDKGFFYTVGELLTRPGHSIREYVQGKRAKHFNYLTFIILLLTIGHIVGNYADVKLIDTTQYFSSDKYLLTRFSEITKENPKMFTLLKIPFLALCSFVFFRKSKQNLTEHLVLNTYKVCGELIIAIFFTILAALLNGPSVLNYIIGCVAVFSLIYSVWFYFQYFSTFGYSKTGLFVRSLLASIILILVVSGVATFMVGMKDGFEGRQ